MYKLKIDVRFKGCYEFLTKISKEEEEFIRKEKELSENIFFNTLCCGSRYGYHPGTCGKD